MDKQFLPVLRIRNPRSGASLTPGSGIRDGKKSRFGIWDEISELMFENLVAIFGLTILKFFDADPDPGSGIFSTLDSGSGIRDAKTRIRDPPG